jgi:hypothetical protein
MAMALFGTTMKRKTGMADCCLHLFKEEAMNTLNLSLIPRKHWVLLGLLVLAPAWLCKLQTTVAAQLSATKPPFIVRSYGGKCLEFGVPRTPIEAALKRNYPVFISDCNGSAVQQIRVEELTDRPGRLVVLRAGNRVIGKKLDAPVLTPLTATAEAESEASAAWPATLNAASAVGGTPDQTPLEVQSYIGAPGQIFALDGDSIILAAERNLVVEVKNNRGANGTPLVLGRRNLDDSEFWDFNAADGSAQRPTSGFVRVPQVGDIRTPARQFVSAVQTAQQGTVIEIAPDVSINLVNYPKLFIGTEVTIRGDRRGTRSGPELYVSEEYAGTMLTIDGHDVRITGLRLRGPSRSTDDDTPLAVGIFKRDDLYVRSIIDHNELSDWPKSAVEVNGGEELSGCNGDTQAFPGRREKVRIVRNFIHHNQRQGEGYGVGTYDSAFPLIEGNTFVSNRHAIASDGFTHTGYRAWYNLVLSTAPEQKGPIPDAIPGLGQVENWYTHDFDMHGTGKLVINYGVDKKEVNGFGGTGGQYVEIARNTFLGTNRPNFKLRGEPCYTVEFHNNVTRQPRTRLVSSAGRQWEVNVAVQCSYCGDLNKLRVYDNNQFNAPNPTDRLGVGDFDGDGKDDLFLATGAAWYYAPAGQAEWRFLNAQTDTLDTLLFGDFDADGRTDVFTQHGGNRWDVSWGGASQWEMINGSGPILGNAAIGDFDGDRRADVFYTDGREWLVSFGGTGYFLQYAIARHRVPNLRFGDFNNDGKTDVFGVVNGQWMVVYGGTAYWTPLRAKLTDSVNGLTVADFNGDGRADVARSISLLGLWQVSWGGTDDWTTLRADSRPLSSMPAIGRFDATPGADVLNWAPSRGPIYNVLLGHNALDIASGGAGAFQDHSRQDMR